MRKNIFVPEDFENFAYPFTPEGYADCANEKLDAFIKTCPVIYSESSKAQLGYQVWDTNPEIYYTKKRFKAYLTFIEELPKEPCKHEPPEEAEVFPVDITGKSAIGKYFARIPKFSVRCCHCGIELVAEWKAKK